MGSKGRGRSGTATRGKQSLASWGIGLILLLAAIVWGGDALQSQPTTDPVAQQPPSAAQPNQQAAPAEQDQGLPRVAVAQLPAEARTTLELIQAGGPFPYRQDDSVFQNRERLLPLKSSGYYHEYTVETPGESDRGSRRIIVGREGEMYYTDDHYSSFARIE